jgi:hypothetical protein
LADGTLERYSGVAGVTRLGEGWYCLELPSRINSSSVAPVATINYHGATTERNIGVVVNDSGCLTNGISVYTFEYVTSGQGTAVTPVQHDGSFNIVVP